MQSFSYIEQVQVQITKIALMSVCSLQLRILNLIKFNNKHTQHTTHFTEVVNCSIQ